MAKVTFFTGLCGSGKTYASRQLRDQYLRRSEQVKMFREVLYDNGAEQFEIIETLKAGIDCIVEEAFYCIAQYREIMLRMLESQVPDAEVCWVCFENDLETANWNVLNRPCDDADADDLVRLNNERLHPNFDVGGRPTIPIFKRPPKSDSDSTGIQPRE